ncbi:MAG: GNAT family N-acetyltransferase [Gordonia sp. (in: high G+C Gram-positive bacteria)]|uniref:GNAT family N-acetyltransferase n=1 Tax=Gordonia sp. (in: high G+C Gram-positive bacteria) TaxID=84139 RepID=UPI0039E3BD8A
MAASNLTPPGRRDTSSIVFAEFAPDDVEVAEAVGEYFAELGERFPEGFDASAPDDGDEFRRPAGCFVVALADASPVACGALRTIGPGIGEIKRMWVHQDWRGAGLGSRMLRELESRSRQLGHRSVRLDTSAALTGAVAMYERAGYRRVHRYNDNPYAELFFEKTF